MVRSQDRKIKMSSEAITPSRESVEDATRSPQPEHITIAVPLGFAGQLRVLQQAERDQAQLNHDQAALNRELAERMHSQTERIAMLEANLATAMRDQAERIAILENHIAGLANQDQRIATVETIMTGLVERVERLEQYNEHLLVRRKEVVGQLLNLRTLHLDADNAFMMRASDIQSDDLEGVLALCNTQIITTMSHLQRALAQLRTTSQHTVVQVPMYHTQPQQGPAVPPALATPPVVHHHVMAPRTGRWYPHWYSKGGYCMKHNTAFPCFTCGK